MRILARRAVRPSLALIAALAAAAGSPLAAQSDPFELPAGLTAQSARPDDGPRLSEITVDGRSRSRMVSITGSGKELSVDADDARGAGLPVQSRLFAWSQADGEDVYAPSSDLMISPSITSIPPGETQIVRVLRNGAASPGEKRYRLVVDQLPDPSAARAGAAEARIRFTVPMFLDRTKSAPAQFDWWIGPNGLELANTGGATARVLQLEVKTASGASVPVERNALRYVLGASSIVWPVENACSLGPVTVTASVDGRTVDAHPRSTCG
jgi:fimbrial chaperone protein